jgi:hypothetical protein
MLTRKSPQRVIPARKRTKMVSITGVVNKFEKFLKTDILASNFESMPIARCRVKPQHCEAIDMTITRGEKGTD